MLHDETLYPDPHAFKPERWLSMERTPDTYSLDIVFGFGRRYVTFSSVDSAFPNYTHSLRLSLLYSICPGRFLADEVLFVTIARVLAAFDIVPARRQDTNEPIIPSEACTDGGIT